MAQPDFEGIIAASQLPPQVRAQLPRDPKPRAPHESLEILDQVIGKLAERGPGAANGLVVTRTRDAKGLTIRIDLPA